MNEGDVQFDPAALGDELMELVVLYLEGWLTGPQRDRLNSLLDEDPSNRDTFVAVCTHASLLASCVGIDEGVDENVEGLGMVGLPAIDGEAGFGVSLLPASGLQPPASSPEPPFPSLSPLPSPLSPDFVGSWAFSYMVATIIMGVAILGFWAYKITHHQHIAEAPSQSVPSEVRPEMEFVGRITGMVDVKWSDDPRYLPPPDFAHVPLGRKYILSSGLMEITYDSGAKVILEGPCTYEVESTAGGYLSLGKLTARVGEDKETKRQGDKGKKADAPSPHLLVSRSPGLPVSPLFSVRTPTAVVTDLGTEFGVEVSEVGDTISHVFRGSVKVQVVGNDADQSAVVLRENESARVEKGKGDGDVRLVLDGTAVDPTKFTKRLVKPTKPISFSGSYDGSYDPYSDTPPAGQSTWRHGTATLTPTPNDDNGVPTSGVANFNDLSTDARLSVYRPMGAGTFSADQANDEYTFSARLKLHGEGMATTPPSLALLCLGFRDEWNGGANYGKVVMLGWFYNNTSHDDNPGGLWFVERHAKGSTREDTTKINNVNYFDDAWHTYRVDKVLEGGVAKVKVYVDGWLKVKFNYDDLPAADSGDNGFGYFGSTPGAARVTVDYFKYSVYTSRPSTSVKGRGRVGPEGNARPSQSPREKTGKEEMVD